MRFCEASAKDNYNVSEIFMKLVDDILNKASSFYCSVCGLSSAIQDQFRLCYLGSKQCCVTNITFTKNNHVAGLIEWLYGRANLMNIHIHSMRPRAS